MAMVFTAGDIFAISMKVLIIGNSGREHAGLEDCSSRSGDRRFSLRPVTPGRREKKVKNIPIAATDIDALIAMARDKPSGSDGRRA